MAGGMAGLEGIGLGCRVAGGTGGLWALGSHRVSTPQDGVGCVENCTYLSSVAYLSVNVVDEPDLAPQFLNEPYVGSVPENCPLVRGDCRLLRPKALPRQPEPGCS